MPSASIPIQEWDKPDSQLLVSTDRARLDRDVVYAFLTTSTWSAGIPRAVVERALEHALCFGLYRAGEQIGFARVTTDYATFAYLADVFVLEAHRGRGHCRWLMECVMTHPALQGLRRWVLATSTAGPLYEKLGWKPLAKPQIYMEIHDPDVYRRG
jgi:GNAT superfamily N-acetyltransferase